MTERCVPHCKQGLDSMTLLRDQAKEEIESHSRELELEAQQLLQAARDEIAVLQGALQAAAAGSSEEVERTLEAAQQAESTAQQMRLETQVVSQQAAAEVAALVSELGSVEAALTQECQEGRASLSALSMQVQQLPGLLARDALERQLLQQALAQAEDDAALREPQLAAESVIGPDADVLAELRAEGRSATAAASTAAAANQATILAAVLFEELAAAKLQHKRERLNQRAQLAQSRADAEIAQGAERASKRELASLLETVASEREAVQAQLRDLDGQLEAASAAEREAQERLQAALESGGDDRDDDEVSELLVANRLLLTKVQTSEKEVRELTAKLEGARAELAGKGGAPLDLDCGIVPNEHLDEGLRQLFQDALSAQVPPALTYPPM